MNIIKSIINYLIMAAIAVIVNLAMSHPAADIAPTPEPDDTTANWYHNQIIINDAEIQLLEQRIDSLTSTQKSTNEKLKTIRSSRKANNPIISAMSSDELTRLLTTRYADSLAGHAGGDQ